MSVKAIVDFPKASPLAIKLDNVTKRYDQNVTLENISLHVSPGEFLTLLGPSGSGKTTLLNIIAGFVHPDQGTLCIGGTPMTGTPPHKRGIGIVFQSYALFPHMNVAENVAFPLKARKIARSQIDFLVDKALSLVKLSGFGARRVDQLSGGQKQRVALARAIVFQPKLILMDEPLSALDKQLREHMQIELRSLHERLGATTIYVTHDQREALTLSDRIAVLNGGRIAQIGTPSQIYEAPADDFVADFIGEGALIPVTREDAYSVILQGRRIRTTRPVPPTGDIALVVRSEKLRLARPDEENLIEAVVIRRIFQGESHVIVAQTNGGATLMARQPAHAETDASLPCEGAAAIFSLHPDHAIIVGRSRTGGHAATEP